MSVHSFASPRPLHCSVATIALLAAASPSAAAVYTVGVGSACTHTTIQAAFDAAEAASTDSTIRITRSATWTAQALQLVARRNVDIKGGYPDCSATTTDGTHTTISGAGGVAAPVLTIQSPVPASTFQVSLSGLTIRDGDAAGSDNKGGGIRYTGNGLFEIADVTIQNNVADYGGGLHVGNIGNGVPARVAIGDGVLILSNTARFDGGGVYLQDSELNLTGDDSVILGNTATGQDNTGYGGGIAVASRAISTLAKIAGDGGGWGAISNNSARYGGGVAVIGTDQISAPRTAELRLYANGTRPGTLRGNSASVAGGGLYLRSLESPIGNHVTSIARLSRVQLSLNTAPEGAMAYLDRHMSSPGDGIGARLEIDYVGAMPEGGTCTEGAYCSRVFDHRAQSASGTPTAGALIWTHSGTVQIGAGVAGALTRGGAQFTGNTSGRLVDGLDCIVNMSNAMIASNTISRQLIGGNCRNFELVDLTIAGNTITQSSVFELTGDSVLRRLIIWQPGKTTLTGGGGTRQIREIVASERASLDAAGALFVEQANPRFVDPANGDFSLRAASPAVDFATVVSGTDRDAMSRPRDVDLPLKAPFPLGSRDLGALERQTLAPLVLNADFDHSDLRQWTHFTGVWDGSQNVSGAANSGSWSYSGTGLSVSRVVLGQQCIHLPGPGRYRLDGRGRGGGSTITTRDYAVLAWEFRRVGTEQCDFGSADASGELTVGAGTSWGQATVPATIEVAPEAWTTSSSIRIQLVAVDGGVGGPSTAISAWFDGIRLDAAPWDDLLFANGFD